MFLFKITDQYNQHSKLAHLLVAYLAGVRSHMPRIRDKNCTLHDFLWTKSRAYLSCRHVQQTAILNPTKAFLHINLKLQTMRKVFVVLELFLPHNEIKRYIGKLLLIAFHRQMLYLYLLNTYLVHVRRACPLLPFFEYSSTTLLPTQAEILRVWTYHPFKMFH